MTRLQLSEQFECCQEFNKYILENHGSEYMQFLQENKVCKDFECKMFLKAKEEREIIEAFDNAILEIFDPLYCLIVKLNHIMETIKSVLALWILGEKE